MEKEGGVALLQRVVEHPRPYTAIRDLSHRVLALCQKYRLDPDSLSSHEQDMVSDHEDDNQGAGGE